VVFDLKSDTYVKCTDFIKQKGCSSFVKIVIHLIPVIKYLRCN